MGNTYINRRSHDGDLSALANLLMIEDVAVGYFGSRKPAAEIAEALHLNLELSKNGRGTVWVTLKSAADPNIIAYAAVCSGYVTYCVAPRHRRRGVATRLLRAVSADAFAMWPDGALSATVSRENVASARLLEKLGFRFVGLEGSRTSTVMMSYELRSMPMPD